MISKENFIQDIKTELSNFIINNTDYYPAFGYDKVRRLYSRIDRGELANQPIIHFSVLSTTQGTRQPVGDVNGEKVEGRKVYFDFGVYTVINTSYRDTQDRGFILDEVGDNLKNIFDSQGDSLPFNQVKFSSTLDELMGENSDGLYAREYELEFWVMKEL